MIEHSRPLSIQLARNFHCSPIFPRLSLLLLLSVFGLVLSRPSPTTPHVGLCAVAWVHVVGACRRGNEWYTTRERPKDIVRGRKPSDCIAINSTTHYLPTPSTTHHLPTTSIATASTIRWYLFWTKTLLICFFKFIFYFFTSFILQPLLS